jgi:hypothetical protein
VTDDDLPSVARDRPTGALVVVHAPRRGKPGRRVENRHQFVGAAFGPPDAAGFVRRASLEDLDLDNAETVSWRGEDAGTW